MTRSGLESVSVGQHYTFAKTVGETDVTLFAGFTGDFSDTHINEQDCGSEATWADASRTVRFWWAICRRRRPSALRTSFTRKG